MQDPLDESIPIPHGTYEVSFEKCNSDIVTWVILVGPYRGREILCRIPKTTTIDISYVRHVNIGWSEI
jgi:hypothetical protein